MRLSSLAAIFFSFALLATAQINSPANPPTNSQPKPQINPDWSYLGKTGPVLWSKISPEYQACSKGRQQSPIDIRNARLNKELQPIEFHYIAGPVTLTNTGRTVQLSVDPGSYIVANGVRYELLYVEFHSPSAHTVHNRLFDMEVNLIHRSTDGREANLAVLMSEERGYPNATLSTLWENLPTRVGQSEKIADMVNPAGLLPGDRGYWTYIGSQLTPPCTEGVQWYVFEQPVSISREQYNSFVALYRRNTRATRDLNGRKIEANE